MPNRPLTTLQHNASVNRSSTSLITPNLTRLSDPPTRYVDNHLLEFLTAEVVRQLIQSERAARERQLAQERAIEADMLANNLGSSLSLKPSTSTVDSTSAPARDQVDQAVSDRLDKMGFKVGWALAEKLARDRPRFPTTPAPVTSTTPVTSTPPAPVPDPLETVKFVCKDVWIALYDKQVDNLRTNHRGVYVLHDNAFRPLLKVSAAKSEAGQSEMKRMTQFFLAYPAGIIRGALANLGLSVTVSGECAGIPQTTFQIKTVRPGS